MEGLSSTSQTNPTATDPTEVLDFTYESQQNHQEHATLLLDMEAKKRSFGLQVPTLPHEIRKALRNIREPICLFGENPANTRDRLRLCMARNQIKEELGQPSSSSSSSQPLGYGDVVATGIVPPASSSVELTNQILQQNQKQKQLQQQQYQTQKYQKYPASGLGKRETEGTKYTHATPDLIKAREYITEYSLPRAKARLRQERNRRKGTYLLAQREKNQKERLQKKRRRRRTTTDASLEENQDGNDILMMDEVDTEEVLEIKKMNEDCGKLYRYTRDEMGLVSSQYGGDSRPLSAISCCKMLKSNEDYEKDYPNNHDNHGFMVVTGGWSGSIRLWNADSELRLLGLKTMAHEDRIMGIATYTSPTNDEDDWTASHPEKKQLLATASIDLTAKLWSIVPNTNTTNAQTVDQTYVLRELAHLKGHQARLCKVAWHPTGRYIGTTSFDHTWRLWDVETGQSILLQDGHWKECYGIAMNHPDGSLCSTTDFGGVVQLWDLRTGKSISHYLGHAKRVLCTEFSPNGFHLATAGDDGMIKIWDLRKRNTGTMSASGKQQAQYASLPGHTKLINQLKFTPSHGESLLSSSFDGTTRIWSARSWKMLTTLRGHEGKVMGADFVDGGSTVVTVGYDKTLKLWS